MLGVNSEHTREDGADIRVSSIYLIEEMKDHN